MTRDVARVDRIASALRDAGCDALVCALPRNVLLLTGYWPVVGTAVAIATAGGRVGLVVPADERELAARGWADATEVFSAGSLREIVSAGTAVRDPLARLLRALHVDGPHPPRVGYERDETFEPASYASLHLYGAALPEAVAAAIPAAVPVSASALLARLRAVLTLREVQCVAAACERTAHAFHAAARCIRTGLRETEIAASFRDRLSTPSEDSARAGSFVFCMSGPNAATAYGAFARSRERRVSSGDLVLVHCNSHLGGYWTDITRTYCLAPLTDRLRAMYDAVLEARAAALDALRPGAPASAADHAARAVLERHGFGDAFKHSTGHGVGFAAIDHNAMPRLHPASPDVLEPGMVCNVEPAIYLDGVGGLRHCDVVEVTDQGARVLTPFHSTVDALVLDGTGAPSSSYG